MAVAMVRLLRQVGKLDADKPEGFFALRLASPAVLIKLASD
jgi:hypothetical protein